MRDRALYLGTASAGSNYTRPFEAREARTSRLLTYEFWRADLIDEMHDCYRPGVTETLTRRFLPNTGLGLCTTVSNIEWSSRF
jgi:hypothetical protein